ncbi:MAG: hypothetical protein ACJ8LI_11335 [Chthoniobacterales bacterium]
MKSKSFIITGAVVAAIAMCGPVTAFAASKKASPSPAPSPAASASPAASPSAKAPRSIPFHGKVGKVDTSAKTFTIEGKTNSRTFKVTDKTTVTNNGAAASAADIKEGANISGSYWKQSDGSLECRSVKIGGASGETKKSTKAAKASPAASPAASPKK